MTIHSVQSNDGKNTSISVIGRFDYSLQKEFCAAFKKSNNGVNSYTVDMKETTHLDSSALGLLLLLRNHANGNASNINIVNCSDSVKRILSIASFEDLFNIE